MKMIDLLDNTEIKYLKDVPEHLDALAQWTYDAWGKYDQL